MNFLAHAYLSGDNKSILVGNLIGDFIKGRQALARLEAGVARGVELHRAIDEYTDNHPVVHESKARLRPKYRHYSGVIVDVFYDHFLAGQWKLFHPRPLKEFASGTYETLTDFSDVLPLTFRQMLPYMIRGNWLVSYSKTEGIHRALSGMASRTPYHSRMDEATSDLQEHYRDFNDEFNAFFPTLRSFCEEWLTYRDGIGG